MCSLTENFSTFTGMLENFLTIVDRFGLIPNGGRVYYLMRSQPPTFIPMVQSYLEKRDDVEFLKQSLPILEKEFNYWMNNHSVLVNKDGVNYTLYRYVEISKGPRPESYRWRHYWSRISAELRKNVRLFLKYDFFTGRILYRRDISKPKTRSRNFTRSWRPLPNLVGTSLVVGSCRTVQTKVSIGPCRLERTLVPITYSRPLLQGI